MRLTTKLAAGLPVALLATTIATAAPAQADTSYYADVWYCFNLVNNTGWPLQASFTPSIQDRFWSRTDYFPGTPDVLAPGQQINNICGTGRALVAVNFASWCEDRPTDRTGYRTSINPTPSTGPPFEKATLASLPDHRKPTAVSKRSAARL